MHWRRAPPYRLLIRRGRRSTAKSTAVRLCPPQIEDSDFDDHWSVRNPTVRNCRTRRNPFIETEAGVDGDASADEDDDDGADLDEFIVDNDVY